MAAQYNAVLPEYYTNNNEIDTEKEVAHVRSDQVRSHVLPSNFYESVCVL